jgi:uncharacterized damage-inducible protein DinB
MTTASEPQVPTIPMSVETLLNHWLGHRRLTRRTIEAFPDDKLFTFSIGGMRTFGEMCGEFLGMELPTVEGLLTLEWKGFEAARPTAKADLLRLWDEHTALITEKLPQIPVTRFPEVHKAFGMWDGTGLALIQYVIDNEIHHRAEGYVYLRALEIAPPPFWVRD